MAGQAQRVRELLAAGSRWLAPLAGVGDPVFRELCHEQGAGLTYTEMVSAKGLHYQNEHTWQMLSLASNEDYAGVQLFGHEPHIMAEQARAIEDCWQDRLALIDINMGCPVAKVVKKGEGAALMKTPELAAAIVSAIAAAVSVPVTIKCRMGFDGPAVVDAEQKSDGVGAYTGLCDFARRMEQSGADAITVHGRYAQQMYRGKADWDAIAAVKQAVDVPVIGNGDLRTQEDIAVRMAQAGTDGVMVARGAQGNPWVFSGHVPSQRERIDCARRHVCGIYEISGQRGLARVRKHVAWYLAGFPYATAIRARVMQCERTEDFEELFCVLEEEFETKTSVCDGNTDKDKGALR